MAVKLTPEVLQDDLAVSVARAMATANNRARELGVNVLESIITITQQTTNDSGIWRINYGPRDYVNRRGGDLIVEVNSAEATIIKVLHGQ